MLVRLTSSTSGDMVMFAEHLRRLYEIIGKECTARGVFMHEQLPEAIARLKEAIAAEKEALHLAECRRREEGIDPDDELDEVGVKVEVPPVHLCQRATPLVHLMEWTFKEKGFILWEADRDF
ncbi:DUF1840 domain-containing protein [Propionivibrio dicarboxylicus]|uniref:DUF1840 domain-containing protein n=1 Tax=Propionivibrio dicarboxylicus TaxID=83767 RepID=A0A1G7WGM9_9RHOO|nr:DUF1840 domain-containing protein [Propionivibrio dicarboxylicus]SDG71123.1 protein of unknown function [Propionivibrio dicarboxylicus]